MPTAFVLYIQSGHAAASLELLRRIAQPTSTSLPHITVRYPVDLLSAADLSMYESTTVKSIELVSPGTFSDTGHEHSEVSTVFLKCASETLEALSYKPQFPDSIFHLSLYDGAPSRLAAEILEVLTQFPWHLTLDFPSTRLTRIPIRGSRPRVHRDEVLLTSSALQLLRELGGDALSADSLLRLSNEDRIKFVYRLAEDLNLNSTRDIPANQVLSVPSVTPAKQRAQAVQPDLWGEVSVEGDGRSDALLSRSARRSLSEGHRPIGLFLTPPELAQDLVWAALEAHTPRPIDFGDPAIGSGIFFASLLRNVDPARIRSAVGVELDERRAETTAARWADRSLTVLTGTFPDVELDENTRSLIIANPPYVRSQSLDTAVAQRWRKKIREEVDTSLGGRADLYVYMVLACDRWMAPGAIAVWLLPSEFAQTQYGAALRSYLTTNVRLLRVHSYDSAHPLFENARVSSTAVVFQNRPPDLNTHVKFSDGGTLARPSRIRSLRYTELATMTKWGAQVWLPSRSKGTSVRLGQLFRVRRGIATGANSRFVLDAKQVADLEVPRRWTKPLVPKTRMLHSNVIESLDNGDPDLEPPIWLIDSDASLQTISRESPKFGRYLSSIKDEVLRSRLVQSRTPYYSQEQHRPSPFLFSSMSRADSAVHRGPFYLNRSRAVNLNNYHSLYPRFDMMSLRSAGVTDVDLLQMLCKIDDEEFAREGRVYVSGLRKVEPKELPELRLNAVPPELLEMVNYSPE